jgi:hypothetical protein
VRLTISMWWSMAVSDGQKKKKIFFLISKIEGYKKKMSGICGSNQWFSCGSGAVCGFFFVIYVVCGDQPHLKKWSVVSSVVIVVAGSWLWLPSLSVVILHRFLP